MRRHDSRQRRTALVAGGAGFLGSHLCEALLRDGMRVVCLDSLLTGDVDNIAAFDAHPRFAFVEADIIYPLPDTIEQGSFEEIYNLACAASPPACQANPEHTLLTSVLGTHRLLRLAERGGARFLLASTSEVYGDPEQHPQTESYRGNVSPTGPRACHDEGKRAAETLVFDYDRAGRAKVRVARIFNTYGPRLRAEDGRVVSNLVVQALAGQPLTVFGDGSQTQSFCYVDDMVRGLIALQRHAGAQPGPVNLGDPTEITIRDLADSIRVATGSTGIVLHQPLPIDDPRRRRPDIGRAWTTLGWAPTTPLDTGLARTVRWFAQTSAAREWQRPTALRTVQ